MAHAVLGGVAGVVWLVLPGMTTVKHAPVAITRPQRAPAEEAGEAAERAGEAAPSEDETSAADLVLPLAVVGAAAVLGGYGYVRRVRRARTRTTPGGAFPSPAAEPDGLEELDARCRTALVEADNHRYAVDTELAYAEVSAGAEAVAPAASEMRAAESELAVAFRMRRRYDEGVPAETAARRHTLAGIVGRCEEADRRLATAAGVLRELRALERDPAGALSVAESRFRELTTRTAAAEAALTELRARYAPTAITSVTGYVELAKDRLMFATTHLNQGRQKADSGDAEEAAGHLRTAEGAIADAAVFVTAVDRLAGELAEATRLIPAVLTAAEAELAGARTASARDGETDAQLMHADAVLASVRQELTSGRPYDPADVLRRVVRATEPLNSGRAGALGVASLLVARGATAAAGDFVRTHTGTVAATARTRLAAARDALAEDNTRADEHALDARELAEQDTRLHGHPYA